REVPRLARDVERADLHLRADGLERGELLGGARAGVEPEVPGGQRDERRELDLERVDLELERVDLAVRERELEANRLVVRRAVRVAVVRGGAIRDRDRERAAREELRAARRDVDRTVE